LEQPTIPDVSITPAIALAKRACDTVLRIAILLLSGGTVSTPRAGPKWRESLRCAFFAQIAFYKRTEIGGIAR
jgi:hypothetical protein